MLRGAIGNRANYAMGHTYERTRISVEVASRLIKCSDRSREVKLPALLGNYDRPTDRPTNQPVDTDRQGHCEVSLQTIAILMM